DESAEVKQEGWLASEPEKDATNGRKIDIELKTVKVSKGMSEKTVREIIKKHIPAFNLCCKQVLKRLPHLKGKIAFRLVVDAAGRVTAVYAVQSAGADKMFEQCMIKGLKTLRFPSTKEKRGAVVTVTFILK
ncbi:AgmX/PglI C-terminal domain-containing protein, partial [Thermodesulfobacteriota bacterium]